MNNAIFCIEKSGLADANALKEIEARIQDLINGGKSIADANRIAKNDFIWQQFDSLNKELNTLRESAGAKKVKPPKRPVQDTKSIEDEYKKKEEEIEKMFSRSQVGESAKTPSGSVGVGGDVVGVFHGTNKEFTEFEPSGLGVHFGTESQAKDRGSKLIKADITLKNPFRMDDMGSDYDVARLADELLDAGLITKEKKSDLQKNGTTEDIKNILKENGYDGIVYKNRNEDKANPKDSYIVFDKSQIKEQPKAETKVDGGNSVGGDVLGKGRDGRNNAIDFPINKNGKEIGGIVISRREGKGWEISNSRIIETEQGKGIGKQAYRELNKKSIEDTGYSLTSGVNLTDQAKGLWESLIKSGEAEKINDEVYQFKAVEQSLKEQPQAEAQKGNEGSVGVGGDVVGELSPLQKELQKANAPQKLIDAVPKDTKLREGFLTDTKRLVESLLGLAGNFSIKENKVRIGKFYSSLFGGRDKVLIHEAAHAATMSVYGDILRNEGDYTKEQVAAARELNDIAWKYLENTQSWAKMTFPRLYGTTNPYEFIAEFIANPKFRDYVSKNSPDKKTNIATYIWDGILKMLGVKKSEINQELIDKIQNGIDATLEVSAAKNKAVEQSLKETPKAGSVGVGGDVHKQNIHDKFRKEFEGKGIPREQVDGAIALMEARAKSWASEEKGRNADDWYGRIADVKSGEFQEETPKQYQLPDGRKVMGMNQPEVVNGFYSPLEKTISETKFNKLPAKQWAEKFANGEEAKWTGLNEWLKQQTGTVSKADIQQYLKENRIQVVEVVKADLRSISDSPKEMFENGELILEKKPNDGVGYVYPFNVVTKDGKFVQEVKSYEDAISNPTVRNEARAINKKNEKIGITLFSKYQLEGQKENYKEVLVTMPSKNVLQTDLSNELLSEGYVYTHNNQIFPKTIAGLADVNNYPNGVKISELPPKAKALAEKIQNSRGLQDFKSFHFDEPNVLVHLRMNTRIDADGNKVLFLEEVQSDWGQEGKKQGFSFDAADKKRRRLNELEAKINRSDPSLTEADEIEWKKLRNDPEASYPRTQQIPAAPFVTETTSWTKLAMKVALKEAVKQGADKIAWTTGEQQNERYDLSKQVDELVYRKNSDGNYYLHGRKDGQNVITETNIPENKIADYVGKYVAERMINNEGDNANAGTKVLKGQQLSVGGKGMKGFYGSPEEGKLGIVGEVAKSLFKQELKTTELTEGKWKEEDGRQVFEGADGTYIGDYSKQRDGSFRAVDMFGREKKFDKESDAKDYIYNSTNFHSTRQHSIDVTPELRKQAEEGQPLFQKDKEGKPKGAVETLADGRKIIHALDAPDFSTMVHEIAHVFEADLTTAEQKIVKDFGGSEPFARGFEKYLRDGKAPTSELKSLFDKFKEWLTNIYKTLKGSPIEKRVTPEIKQIFDRLLIEQKAVEDLLGAPQSRSQVGESDVSAREFKVKPPKKLYRGIAEGVQSSGEKGVGTYFLGKGVYSTFTKEFAKKYGKVVEIDPKENFPKNPLVLTAYGNTIGAFNDWALKESGEKNIRDFNKKYPDAAEFVKSKGYDGVIVGDEIVKYSTAAKSRSQLDDDAKGEIDDIVRAYISEGADLNKILSEFPEDYADSLRESYERITNPPPITEDKEQSMYDFSKNADEKAFIKRMATAVNVPETWKKAVLREGTTYVPQSQTESRLIGESIVAEFGAKAAADMVMLNAKGFSPDVITATVGAALNELYMMQLGSTTTKEEFELAGQWADMSIRFDELFSRAWGRGVAQINDFYKHSPLGIVLKKMKLNRQMFDLESKKHGESWDEFYDRLMEMPEFAEVVSGRMDEELRRERAAARKNNKSRVHKTINKVVDEIAAMLGRSRSQAAVSGAADTYAAMKERLMEMYDRGDTIESMVKEGLDIVSRVLGTDEFNRDAVADSIRKMFGKHEGIDTLERAKQNLRASIDRIKKQIKNIEDGIAEDKAAPGKATDAELASLEKQRDELMRELDNIRKSKGLGRFSEESMDSREVKKLEAAIKEVDEQIEKGKRKEKKKSTKRESANDKVKELKSVLKEKMKQLESIAPLTETDEFKMKVLDKLRNRLSGLTERQKDKVVRQTYIRIIANKGLSQEDFRKIIADALGLGSISAEQQMKLERLTEMSNVVKEKQKKLSDAIKAGKPEAELEILYTDLKASEIKGALVVRDLKEMFDKKDDILMLIGTLIQGTAITATTAALLNTGFNVFTQALVRFPSSLVDYVMTLPIPIVGRSILGKEYRTTLSPQWHKKAWFGVKESFKQIKTGMNRLDYEQKELLPSQIRPSKAFKKIAHLIRTNKAVRSLFIKLGANDLERGYEMSTKQITHAILEIFPGISAEAIFRLLNLGDKPFRFGAEGAKGAAWAKMMGISTKGIEFNLFLQMPVEFAYKYYYSDIYNRLISEGRSEEYAEKRAADEAMQRAEYVRESIIREGEHAVMQQKNIMTKLLNDNDIMSGGFARLIRMLTVSPFVKTLANMSWSFINLAHPTIAIGQTGFYLREAQKAKTRGDIKSMLRNKREAQHWLSHAAVGIGWNYVVVHLLKIGVIAAAGYGGEDDPKKKREFDRTVSTPHTFNITKFMSSVFGVEIGDGVTLSLNLNTFSQLGNFINYKANHFGSMSEEEFERTNILVDMMLSGYNIGLLREVEAGALSNASSLMKAVASGSFHEYYTNTIGLLMNLAQPATFAQINREGQKYYTKRKGDTFGETIENMATARGWDKPLGLLGFELNKPEIVLDVFGMPVRRQGNMFLRMLGIYNKDRQELLEPIQELQKRVGNNIMLPPSVENSVDGVELPKDKFNDFKALVGTNREFLLEGLYGNNLEVRRMFIDGYKFDFTWDMDIKGKLRDKMNEFNLSLDILRCYALQAIWEQSRDNAVAYMKNKYPKLFIATKESEVTKKVKERLREGVEIWYEEQEKSGKSPMPEE